MTLQGRLILVLPFLCCVAFANLQETQRDGWTGGGLS